MQKGELRQLIQTINSFGQNTLLRRCGWALEELQKELQRQEKINQQQKHLIRILQESKEYYEQQYRNNSYQQQCQHLAAEIARANAVASAYKRASIQMKERMEQMQARMQQLSMQLKEKNQLLEESQQAVRREKAQKQVLEVQWSKVVRAVKRKIATISQKEQTFQANKQNYMMNTKANEGKNCSNDEGRTKLINRAYKMLAHLQKEQAIQEFEGLFMDSQGSSNKSQRKQPLKENRQISILFNSARK